MSVGKGAATGAATGMGGPTGAAAVDYELLQRMAAGDETALAALYDRHCRLVMSVALAVVGDRATAEEVTLDVFLTVWQRAADYDPALAQGGHVADAAGPQPGYRPAAARGGAPGGP